jgi:hypothetical protein
VLGWGSTTGIGQDPAPSNVLRAAAVQEIPLKACNESYQGIITTSMLCAGGSYYI